MLFNKRSLFISLFLIIFSFNSFAEKEKKNTSFSNELTSSDANVLEYTGLDCVYQGIEKATEGNAINSLKPSVKWLSLLAEAAHEFYNVNYQYGLTDSMPPKVAKEYKEAGVTEPKTQYYIKVIQMVQAFGYCSAEKLSANSELSGKMGFGNLQTTNKVNKWLWTDKNIPERDIVISLASGSMKDDSRASKKHESYFKDSAKIFGFKDTDGIKSLAVPSRNWASMSVEERREHFNDFISKSIHGANLSDNPSSAYIDLTTDEGTKLKNCLEDIQTLQKRSSFFGVKPGENKNSMKMCQEMAKSCEINTNICDGAVRGSKTSDKTTAPTNVQVGDLPQSGSK